MNYDDVLIELGELGRWQITSLLLIAILGSTIGIDATLNVFTGESFISLLGKISIDWLHFYRNIDLIFLIK